MEVRFQEQEQGLGLELAVFRCLRGARGGRAVGVRCVADGQARRVRGNTGAVVTGYACTPAHLPGLRSLLWGEGGSSVVITGMRYQCSMSACRS